MKFRITFEINAKGTSFEIKDKEDEVTAVLQNLSSWFNNLHLHFLEQRCSNMSRGHLNEATKKALDTHIKEELKLSEQLFNNYTVEGECTDGSKFTFTHKDPGYRETMTWQGEPTKKV
jgi:hypothetical protein